MILLNNYFYSLSYCFICNLKLGFLLLLYLYWYLFKGSVSAETAAVLLGGGYGKFLTEASIINIQSH